ncbi:MAG: hypothetical protein JO115_19975 [Pseudonocardiales bacterium]|nr:hypothetical protein [Pseudonocardiales bacterium]
MTTPNEHPGSPGVRWWETPGSLRTGLLRCDGQVATAVNAEKYVVGPTVVSGEVAEQLGRLAQQMGVGDGALKQPSGALGFEPLKPGFTREAGSIQRQGNGQ